MYMHITKSDVITEIELLSLTAAIIPSSFIPFRIIYIKNSFHDVLPCVNLSSLECWCSSSQRHILNHESQIHSFYISSWEFLALMKVGETVTVSVLTSDKTYVSLSSCSTCRLSFFNVQVTELKKPFVFQGAKIIQSFMWYLNPRQVFDLSQGGPKEGWVINTLTDTVHF